MLDFIKIFESVVDRNPKRVAIKYQGREETYSWLNEKANQSAHFLLETQWGANPSDIQSQARFGIIGSNTPELIVAQLACLKVGAAYVVIDPNTPSDRLNFIVEDAELSKIINLEQLDFYDLNNHELMINAVDIVPQVAQKSELNLEKSFNQEISAYYLYTSGSTGEPKGVVQTIGGLVRQIKAYSQRIGIRSDDELFNITPLTHDQGMVNEWSALLNGCCLHLYSLDDMDFNSVRNYIKQENISIYVSVPTIFKKIFSDGEPEDFTSLRIVRLGGEETKLYHARLFQEKCSANAEFITLYGSTECSAVSTNEITSETDLDKLDSIPLGVPLNHISYLISSKEGLKGGELLVHSPYMARYTKVEENERAHKKIEGLLYLKTGDLVLPQNKNLVFLGRQKWHAKILGNRVNLRGVESFIEKNILVEQNVSCECIVVTIGEEENKKMVAFILSSDIEKSEINIEKVFSALEKSFEVYEIPYCMHEVEEFPLLENGKINRKELKIQAEKYELAKLDRMLGELDGIESLPQIVDNLIREALVIEGAVQLNEKENLVLNYAFSSMQAFFLLQKINLALECFYSDFSPKLYISLEKKFLTIEEIYRNSVGELKQCVKNKAQKWVDNLSESDGNEGETLDQKPPKIKKRWASGYHHTEGSRPMYLQHSQVHLNIGHREMEILATHYSEKYEIDISVSCFNAKLIDSINKVVEEGVPRQVGFIHKSENMGNGHYTPMVLAFHENRWNLFIADALCVSISIKIADIFEDMKDLSIHIDFIKRQERSYECCLDAFLYLERALKNVRNFSERALILNKCPESKIDDRHLCLYPLFLSPPECIEAYPYGTSELSKRICEVIPNFSGSLKEDNYVEAVSKLVEKNRGMVEAAFFPILQGSSPRECQYTEDVPLVQTFKKYVYPEYYEAIKNIKVNSIYYYELVEELNINFNLLLDSISTQKFEDIPARNAIYYLKILFECAEQQDHSEIIINYKEHRAAIFDDNRKIKELLKEFVLSTEGKCYVKIDKNIEGGFKSKDNVKKIAKGIESIDSLIKILEEEYYLRLVKYQVFQTNLGCI